VTTDTPHRSGTRARIWTATAVAGREVLRDPVLLGLLAFLPVYFIGLWGWILPEDPVQVEIATADGTATVATDFVSLMLALVGPVTGALLVGIAGLFIVQRSRGIDERLRVVGYRGPELLVARLALLAGIAAVVVLMSLAVTVVRVVPEHVGWFLLALVLTAATYGAIGVLTGLVLDRMAGVYLLLFAPMLDILLLGLPLGEPPGWSRWLPGHHAAELALSAFLGESVAVTHGVWSVAVVAAFAALSVFVSAWR
jgi:ABC-2 type transport system permease protein